MMSELRTALDEILSRANSASPGPWVYAPVVGDVVEGPGVVTANGLAHEVDFSFSPEGREQGENDAHFIAAARSDVPRLVTALKAVLTLAEEGLATKVFTASDGYPSVAVQDNDSVREKICAAIEAELA